MKEFHVVIVNTPAPPYYAVIFSPLRTAGDDGYGAMSDRMLELVARQPGFLGVESAREGLGITHVREASVQSGVESTDAAGILNGNGTNLSAMRAVSATPLRSG